MLQHGIELGGVLLVEDEPEDEIRWNVNDPCALDAVDGRIIWAWRLLQNGDSSERQPEGKQEEGGRGTNVRDALHDGKYSHSRKAQYALKVLQGYACPEGNNCSEDMYLLILMTA